MWTATGTKATWPFSARAAMPCGSARSVFDGARWFEGVAPDLDLHADRVNASALSLGLKPTMAADEIVAPDPWTGLKKFDGNDRRLYPADVLGRAWRLYGRSGRSRLDALLPVPLRIADDRAVGLLDHRFAVPPPDARDNADQCQGRLPLPQQWPRHPRGQDARFRQRAGARHAGQCRRDRQLQHLHGQGRARVDAGCQRHVPVRHHARPHRWRCWPTTASERRRSR